MRLARWLGKYGAFLPVAIPIPEMPSKRFLVHYPDDTKEQISPAKRDEMLLRDELEQIDSKRYRFVGVYTPKTFKCKSFEGLRSLLLIKAPCVRERRYVDIPAVIFELRGEYEWQSEERPSAFYERLQRMGMPPTGFWEEERSNA